MSAKPSYIPVFPDSYLRDTTHLTPEEHGVYFLLLMAAWAQDDCSLPFDTKRLAALAKVTPARWAKLAPTILEFWTISGGRIYQKRLRQEWSYVNQRRAKRKDAAHARWNSKSDANAQHMECTYGEGEGEGPIQAEGLVGGSSTREAGPFSIVGGRGR